MKKERQEMKRTSGATGEYYLMTIPEYWDRFCSDIQEKRDWEETRQPMGANGLHNPEAVRCFYG